MTTLSYNNEGLIDESHYFIPGEQFFEQMIPLFKYERILNQTKSIREGRAVVDIREVVEMRFAQNPGYVPVFPVEATYRTINGRPITFAERWKEQREAFLNNEQQHAVGTPLEELRQYGATPAQISMCRASNIQTIEALHALEGNARKRLGVVGNDIIPMAQKWMEARDAAIGSDNATKIAELEAQVKALLEANKGAPIIDDHVPEELDAGDPYPDKSDKELKDMIAETFGERPKGNPSRETLLAYLAD